MTRLQRRYLRQDVSTQLYDKGKIAYIFKYQLDNEKLICIKVNERNSNSLLTEIIHVAPLIDMSLNLMDKNPYSRQLVLGNNSMNNDTSVTIEKTPINIIDLTKASVLYNETPDCTTHYLDRHETVEHLNKKYFFDFTTVDTGKNRFIIKEGIISGEIFIYGEVEDNKFMAKHISKDLNSLIDSVTSYISTICWSIIICVIGIVMILISITTS